MNLPIQLNGKLIGHVEIPDDITVQRAVIIPGKLINLVTEITGLPDHCIWKWVAASGEDITVTIDVARKP